MAFDYARSRLKTEVAPEPNSGCLLWLGGCSDTGYGSIGVNGRRYHTHRLAWEFANGPIPDGQYVLHKCDVRCCINPDHLYAGTAADNVRDAMTRGRHHHGETHASAKLTEADILAILSDKRRTTDIANEYGVSVSHISGLRNGRFWRHLRDKKS